MGLSQQDWHRKFMYAAKHLASWSKCRSRQIGAVIVRDKTIISTGYNGPPRGVPHCGDLLRHEQLCRLFEKRADIPKGVNINTMLLNHRGCPRKIIDNIPGTLLELCIAAHAEQNAITNAAREGVNIKGADLYCYCPLPCRECAKSIINAGIKTVFYIGEQYDDTAEWLFTTAGVETIPLKDIL